MQSIFTVVLASTFSLSICYPLLPEVGHKGAKAAVQHQADAHPSSPIVSTNLQHSRHRLENSEARAHLDSRALDTGGDYAHFDDVAFRSAKGDKSGSMNQGSQFRMVALPYQFRRYDLNKDGFVTALELADSTGTLLEDSDRPFRMADSDDDGLLTEREFRRAPWVFDHRRDNFDVSSSRS